MKKDEERGVQKEEVEKEEDKPAAEAMFKKVARAYEVLGDDDLRRRYDAGEDVDDANAMNQRQQQQQGFGGFGGFQGGPPPPRPPILLSARLFMSF